MPDRDRGADIHAHDQRPGADHPNLDSYVEHDGARAVVDSFTEPVPVDEYLDALDNVGTALPFVNVGGPTLSERVADYLDRQWEAKRASLDKHYVDIIFGAGRDEPAAVEWHVDYCRDGCPCH